MFGIGFSWLFKHLGLMTKFLTKNICENHRLMCSLSDYEKVEEFSTNIFELQDNLSGVSIFEGLKFVVVNNPPKLIKFSTTTPSELHTEFELVNFVDTEGVLALSETLVAIAEEDIKAINICSVPTSSSASAQIFKEDCNTIVLQPHFENVHNKGIEGLSYNPNVNKFYAVQEKKPMRVLLVDPNKTGDNTVDLFANWDYKMKASGLKDLAAIHYDNFTDTLLLLSEESQVLARTTLEGEIVDKLDLRPFGLSQPEGVSATRERLVIVGEPAEYLELSCESLVAAPTNSSNSSSSSNTSTMNANVNDEKMIIGDSAAARAEPPPFLFVAILVIVTFLVRLNSTRVYKIKYDGEGEGVGDVEMNPLQSQRAGEDEQ